MIVGKTMFSLDANYSNVNRMRQRFDDLQVQLATGKRAQTLSDMGSDRGAQINLRHQLSLNVSYQSNVAMVGTRLNVLELVLTRMDKIESEARSFAVSDAVGENQVNLGTAQSYARAHLDEVLNLLNMEVAGRYMFAGRDTDDPPVLGMEAILNGEDGRDGFRTIVTERKAADAGASGLGRLDLGRVGTTITLAEDGVHPFGYKISGASTDSGGVTITPPAGAPQTMDIEFTAQPANGEKIYVTLTLPDSTTQTLELMATNNSAPGAGEFYVGATSTDTATNFEAALQEALIANAGTELSAASVFEASENFFNGNGETILRVDGPPFDSAMALIAATPTNTITWYDGSSSTNIRNSVSARVGENASVGYGVEGNEKGFLELVRSLASVAVETFSASDPTSAGRYDALTDKQATHLAESNNNAPGSIEVISMELGVVRKTMGSYLDLNKNYQIQMESAISAMEDVSIEETIVRLQNLQVRLQASYKTMATISELTLVNYIR